MVILNIRVLAIVLLATTAVACTIGGLPPQPNQDAAIGVGGAGGRSIGANADAANVGTGIEAGTNSGGAGTTGSAGGAPSTGGIPAIGGTGKGGVLGGTGGVSISGGTTTTGGTTASGGPTSAGGTTTIGGTTGSGGTSSSGGTSLYGGTPPSCSGLAATCGPYGNDDCCTSLLVLGGTFYRSYDGVAPYTDMSYPATVDSFYLDKYEITVGRLRQFVNQGLGTQTSPPSAGDGVHPGITGSGWNSTWNTNLPANTASLTAAIKCSTTWQTWTDTAGSNESKPVNCLDWYTAFAFCAWDGGRLATEAEWNYAAAGGNEQRYYPWSVPATSTTIDDSYAVYNYCGGSCNGPQNVGSKAPKGDGKWGQSDLAGNISEWTLDWYAIPYSMPCNDCADMTAASNRVVRGGDFIDAASLLQPYYRDYGRPPGSHYGVFGARCARTSL